MTLFRETQKITQMWVWIFLIGFNAFILLSIFKQATTGFLWGEISGNYQLLIPVVITWALTAFIAIIRLKTEITEAAIHLKFFPLMSRTIFLTDVQEAYVREASPIREFGGWGIKYGFSNGIAYNTSGRHGLQLVLNNGKKIFIGTQQPQEVKKVIQHLN